MTFTGKATYTAGPQLPEIAEDVSDIISIVSPWETPLLDHFGEARRGAQSTIHEWLEDALLPNEDTINQKAFNPDATSEINVTVANADRFRVGDQVRPDGSSEVMMVVAVAAPVIVVVRGYGGTTPEPIANGQRLLILGNAALEGDIRPQARFTNRVRKQNYTQIFTASVEVSGSQLAVNTLGTADELDYQKQERLRELLRDLENSVINGVASASDPQGSQGVRRTMRGILPMLQTHRYIPGDGIVPDGDGAGNDMLNEAVLNGAMRAIWEESGANVDTIVVNGFQKRRINQFIAASRRYSGTDDSYRDMVSTYESDFGMCRVVLSRWAPADSVLLLDSSRIDVLPLAGRTFHYKPQESGGDSTVGQLIGEYTLELRNENAHGLVRGLATV